MGKRKTISLIDYTKQFIYPNCKLPTKWIFIDGEKSNYKVRTDGAVISVNHKPISDEIPYILCGGMDSDGYHLVTLHHNKKYYTRKVHRLVAEAFIPNPYNKPEVNHINGDKMDNDVTNLEWASECENTHHAMSINLRNQINSEESVKKCCMLLETNRYSFKEISDITGISCSNIAKIRCGYIWKHISNNYNINNYQKHYYSK